MIRDFKIFLGGVIAFAILYIYITFIISHTLDFDICLLKEYDYYCTLESTTNKNCVRVILSKNLCEKYMSNEFLKCYKKQHSYYDYCQLYLSYIDYHQEMQNNRLENPSA